MNELVYLKKDDAFTDSMVIAKATENQHNSVRDRCCDYYSHFLAYDKVGVNYESIQRI